MRTQTVMMLVSMAVLLAACEADVGKEDSKAEIGNRVADAADAEEGKLSIDAPGFEMKVDLPTLRKHANVETSGESDILYPGSQIGAMHIDAKNEQGSVDLRFTSRDQVDTVAGWYRDPARSKEFKIGSPRREGAAYLFDGQDNDGKGSFQLRLEPAKDGGTAGRLLLTDD